MGKRIVSVIMFMILMLSGVFYIQVSAKTVNKSLLAEQAKGKAPNVKVYMTGEDMTSESAVSGSVEDIALTQSGDIKTFDETGESLRYIILFDNSGSINKVQFDEAKNQLKNLRQNMKNNDEMLLYTVGTIDVSSDKTDVFGRTALASETDKVEDDNLLIDDIEYISSRDGKTILYKSINQVIEEQSSQTSIDSLRTVILIITDGEDDSDDINGRDNDKDTTLTNVINSSIPVYGILLNNTAKVSNEEKIIFTKNQILNPDNGHGYYCNCSDDPTVEKVDEGFADIDSILRKGTYVVNLVTDNNKTTVGKKELNLTVNNQSINPVILDYSDYEQDKDAPTISGNIKKESRNSITFTLDDTNGVNDKDASDATHYSIQMKSEGKDKEKDKDKEGKVWTIDQVNVNRNGTAVTVTLTLKEDDLYNGDYTLTIDGIKDESQDQNAMVKVKGEFSVDDGLDAKSEARKEFIQKYWWILLIVLIVTIGIIIIIIAKKKAVKIINKEVDYGKINQSDSMLVRLTITDRTGTVKDVEWNIEGSLFVGRSDICNIFFDDDRLSKQHFVLEVNKTGCYIEDLESTNGTFVNGVKMTNRRLLLDGDIITAGREKIEFHAPKNGIPLSDEDSTILEDYDQ